ncbi:MAG: DM13 domain-containing protein [Acidobacteriota bacterium]
MKDRYRLSFSSAFLIFGLTACAAMADAAEYRRVLPGLANTFGANGTRFESTVWITNLGPSVAQIELGFIPFSGSSIPQDQLRILARGETIRLNNALLDLFGLDGTAGTLTARGDQPFDLRAFTANVANPLGTYGLSLESVSGSQILTAGRAGHAIWLSHGTDFSRGSRTNVTVALLAPNSQVTVSVYDAANTLRGLQVVSSETPTTWQASVGQLVGDPEIAVGRVKFAVTAGEVTGFTSVVDNVTGDGFVVQSEESLGGAADLLLNGVARTPGANNTRFVSDVRLFNPNETQQTVTMVALGFPGGSRSISRSLGPNGLLEISDVLGPNGFDLPDGVAGALRLQAPLPLLAAGRTRSADPSGGPGTFSTFQRTVAYEQGFAGIDQPVTLIGLNQTSDIPGFRSNLALFAGSNGATGTLRLCDRFGTQVATAGFSLQVNQWLQQRITGWFPGVEIPRDARVDVSLSNGLAHGYAAIVDNFTGDGVVVAPIPLSPSTPATAGKLIFSSVPSSVVAGSSFQVVVRAVRADNSLDETFTGTIQLSVASGPGSLQGTLIKTASAGTATFEGLSLSVAGSYVLNAAVNGLEAAVSGPVEVTAAGPTAIKVGTFSGQNGYTSAGTLQILREQSGVEVLKLNSDFRVSSGAGSVSIWLARSDRSLNSRDSVKLGTLTNRFSGEFTFSIPSPGSAGFTHVITYCDAFQVNFGAAPLRNP